MSLSVIYSMSCICHPEEGIRYIGQTRRGMEKRLYEHLWDSSHKRRRSTDFNLPVHNWVRKHGASNITMSVVEETPEGRLDEREIHWIAHYRGIKDNLLNIHNGGESRSGWTHTHETRRRIGEAGRMRIGGNRTIKNLKWVPEIRTRLEKGESYASIARDYEVGYSVVAEIADGRNYAKVNDEGVFDPSLPEVRESIRNGHSSHRKLEKGDANLILLLEQGVPYQEIADEYGVTTMAIANYVFRGGLTQRTPRLTDEQKTGILREHRENPSLSLRGLGRKFGTTHVTVRRVLQEAGSR